MPGRPYWLAAFVLIVGALGLTSSLRGQQSATTPAEPAAPAPQPKPHMARIWANEPPLVRLARDRFGEDFNEVDAKLFAAVAANDWADFRKSDDAKFDAAEPSSWADAAVLKADRLAWLCTDPAALRLVPKRGIWLRGAKITGKIDLYRAEFPFPLTMYDCLLSGGINLEHARLQEIDIRNSCSAPIYAPGLHVDENVYLNGTCVYGGINFIDAQIAGDLDFTGGLASFPMPDDQEPKPGVALNFHDAKIGGDVRIAEKFRARGHVRMIGAQLGRSLICTNSEFSGLGDVAIDAQRCVFGGSVLMDGSFNAEGGVTIRRSRIGSDLDCDGGRFITANVDALNADLIDVGDQVYLGDGFHAEGEVRLIGAEITGDIDCDNGHFLHAAGDALSLDSAVIGSCLRMGIETRGPSDQNSNLPIGFVAQGTVRMWGTRITQDLVAAGGQFETPEGIAIQASNLSVGSRIVLILAGVQGTATFFSADVGHEFDCRGTHFDAAKAPGKAAFIGNSMRVRGHFYCNQFISDKSYNFHVDGGMTLSFATIDMNWDLYGAELSNPKSDAIDASDCRVGGYVNIDSAAIDGRASFSRAKIDGMWILLNAVKPERTHFDMRFAHIWVIKDDKLSDWPPAGQIQLEGLVYDHFDDDSPLTVQDRLAWLRRQYAPVGPAVDEVESDAGLIDRDVEAKRRSGDPRRQLANRPSYRGPVRTVGYEASAEAENPLGFESLHMTAPAEEAADAAQPSPDTLSQPGMAAPAPTAESAAPEQMAAAEENPDEPEIIEGFETTDQLPTAPAPDLAGRRYLTQPYTQLSLVYRAIGQDEEANAVLVARAQRIGELSPLLSAQGLWYRYLGRLIGYGYEPFRAIKIGVAIIIAGTIVFAIGARRNLMAETKLAEQVLSQENEPRLVSATYPRFNPLVYSLDVFLPFVDLQQICYWLPGERLHGPRASRNCFLHIGKWSLKWSGILRTYFWFQTLAGWTLCTLLAAAVTGIVES